jgi:hypothetical protein
MPLGAWKGLAVIGVMAALMVSGVGMLAFTDASMELGDEMNSEPEVEVIEQLDENGTSILEIRVGVRAEGQPVAIQGATVQVLSVDALGDNDTVTITIDRVADGMTDENGTVSLEMDHGKYLVIATYEGLTGLGKCNLDGDESMVIQLHNWDRDCNQFRKHMVNAYKHMESITIQIDLEDLPEQHAIE